MGFDMSEVEALAADLAAAPAKLILGATLAVAHTAQSVLTDAQGLVPVLTGTLRDNITADTHGLEATITASTDYARFVEDGTSDTAPQPFMRPAAEAAETMLAELIGLAAEAAI